MDLTEAENIKKRWQKYTEELYKKDLHGPDNHNGVMILYHKCNLGSPFVTQFIKQDALVFEQEKHLEENPAG